MKLTDFIAVIFVTVVFASSFMTLAMMIEIFETFESIANIERHVLEITGMIKND